MTSTRDRARSDSRSGRSHSRWLLVALAAIAALAFWLWRDSRRPDGFWSALTGGVGELVRDPELKRAQELIFALDATVADYEEAERRVTAVLARRPDDPAAVIVAAEVNFWYYYRGFDRREARYWDMQRLCRRAIELAPRQPEALAVMGEFLLARETDLPRAADLLRRAIALKPDVARWHSSLADVLRLIDPPAGFAVLQAAAARFPDDVLIRYNIARHYRDTHNLPGFEQALDEAIALYPLANALLWKARVQLWAHGDPDGMRATLEQVPAPLLVSERAAINLFVLAYISRDATAALEILDQLPNDWFDDYDYVGPKGLLIGGLLELQGNSDQARIHYQRAYADVARRKPANRADPNLRVGELWTLIALGRLTEGRAAQSAYLATVARPYRLGFFTNWWFSEIPAALLLGDRETALQLIREAAETAEGRDQLRTALRIDPRMAPWREDPAILAALSPT